ncbi:MAG: aminotransferase class I/II-fold pyridoxal phosphate-dependent enzyme [Flavobacteriaceae bacterium]
MEKHKESMMMSLGYNPEWSEGSVKPPIFQTSTFGFKTAEEGKRFFEIAYGKSQLGPDEQMGLIYSRLNNPNMQILEERLAVLEGSEDAAAFESGMSAISTAMLAYLKPNDVLLISDQVYGGTHHFVHHFLKDIGVEVVVLSAIDDVDTIMTQLKEKNCVERVRMIYTETPANPTGKLIDLALLEQLKSTLNEHTAQPVISAVDNTYLGPIWQNPIELGTDLVCYSATKFLNGHSDVIAGAVMGSKEHIAPVKGLRTFLGGMIAPYTAWLLTRSLETLHVRMDYQTKNAAQIAEFLEGHEKVTRVYFPGLPSMGTRQNAIYNNQCKAPGAMISFVVLGDEEGAFRFLNALKLVKLAVSLGSNESLAQHPFSMTHANVPDDEKLSTGVALGLVRLSVGIEHVEDLIDDLSRALEQV